MKKLLLFITLTAVTVVCAGCDIGEEYREEIHLLEYRNEELEYEITCLEEEISYLRTGIDEINGCLETFEDYLDGKYDDFMSAEEAVGYIYYARDLCRDLT